MKLNRLLAMGGSILLIVLQSALATAEQVELYERPPSAAELGQVLFGHQAKESGNVTTRSININPKSKSPIATAQRVEAERKSVGLPIEFAYNSTQILPDSKPFLDEVGKMLNMPEYAINRLIIEGHTDAAGSDAYNLALSKRRARAVSDYLVENFRIPRTRLQSQGLGETKPIAGRDSYDEVNRRVQFYSAN
ncbi:MAG: OmpA family protein [Methyloglobulus sp.]|nr:OmpA family protein [Methyloglobulus sp.]